MLIPSDCCIMKSANPEGAMTMRRLTAALMLLALLFSLTAPSYIWNIL